MNEIPKITMVIKKRTNGFISFLPKFHTALNEFNPFGFEGGLNCNQIIVRRDATTFFKVTNSALAKVRAARQIILRYRQKSASGPTLFWCDTHTHSLAPDLPAVKFNDYR